MTPCVVCSSPDASVYRGLAFCAECFRLVVAPAVTGLATVGETRRMIAARAAVRSADGRAVA
jgi:hypothetical protein